MSTWRLVFLNLFTSSFTSIVVPVYCKNGTSKLQRGCSEALALPNSVYERTWENDSVECSFEKPIAGTEYLTNTLQDMNVDSYGESGSSNGSDMVDLSHGDRKYCTDYLNGTLVNVTCSEEVLPGKGISSTFLQNPIISMVCWVTSIVLVVVTCALTLTERSVKKELYVPYLVSLSLAYAASFTSILGTRLENLKCWQCLLTGYSLQYFGLSAFFWMNAMSIHAYLIICRRSEQRMKMLTSCIRQKWKVFLVFSVYAWGMPLLISAATYSLQTRGIFENFNHFEPDIGTTSCFLRKRTTKWVYFYGPMAVLIVSNLILLELTTVRLIKTQICVARFRRGRTKTTRSLMPHEIWFFKQYLKLFTVTGITWGLGVTIWDLRDSTQPWLKTLSQVSEIVISMQGLFIFYIFVYQKKVLARKLCCLLFLPRPEDGTLTKRDTIEGSGRCSDGTEQYTGPASNSNPPTTIERRISNIFCGTVHSVIFYSAEEVVETSVDDTAMQHDGS
ncbi:hypothetical protein GE061_018484 [Apolygus lucorum]|uniref:G-protein coupled receptors family 2 profile 2 domain-containing protein n=1 Tax=Apolygus lucorum TaxID=248454 RepID=A0A8S9XE59_APOLU|nr:hypothetical protein GE061_018484 [Apolygus lucorum]